MPKFSVIAVDYEKHVPRDGMRRGLASVFHQTFTDWELLICHDGPKRIAYEDEVYFPPGMSDKTRIMNTRTHAGVQGGHHCRDFAMRQAKGEWFLQFNVDNLLYPYCLEKINAHIEQISERIIIFPIWHRKLRMEHLTGVPPLCGQIDCLQLVAHSDVWKEVGYWYDLQPSSDGYIYEAMCKKYPYATMNEVLAENF